MTNIVTTAKAGVELYYLVTGVKHLGDKFFWKKPPAPKKHHKKNKTSKKNSGRGAT